MPTAWAIWLALFIVSFGVLEGWALKTGRWTLSRTVWMTQHSWPLLAVLYGLVFGGLAVHFFWPGEGCNLGPP